MRFAAGMTRTGYGTAGCGYGSIVNEVEVVTGVEDLRDQGGSEQLLHGAVDGNRVPAVKLAMRHRSGDRGANIIGGSPWRIR